MRYWVKSHLRAEHTDSIVTAKRLCVEHIKTLKAQGFGYCVWWAKLRDLEKNRECLLYCGRDGRFHTSRWHEIFM